MYKVPARSAAGPAPAGAAVLVPGAVLLGNHGDCFECGHEHGVGDRCLAFHFAPDFLETIAAAAQGARRIKFAVPRLPPLPRLMPLLAAAEAARDVRGGEGSGEMEELAVMLAGSVLAELAAADRTAPRPSPRDTRRVAEAFVLDPAGTIRYRGRIDDQYGVGVQRPRATRNDLADALEELLAGKPVSRPVTAAPGCLIGRTG